MRLTAILTNIGSDSRVIRPSEVLSAVVYSFKPRSAGGSETYGSQFVHAVIWEDPLALLPPGGSITSEAVLKLGLLPAERHLEAGTYVLSVKYCEVVCGALHGIRVRQGCVQSNEVTIEMES